MSKADDGSTQLYYANSMGESTEKIPGMFGTLVICLPSPHEGGDVILKHGGQVGKFTSSTREMSAVAW